ncbi:MAG: hypothetical protein Q8K02_16540 [Flavobacterium sp.]|nr:hypothetical protein [Flavobacterium sp.]
MKTTINIFLSITTFLISILLFSSCASNELDKKEATALISKIPNEIVKGKIRINLQHDNYDQQRNLNSFNTYYGHLVNRGILTNPEFFEVRKPGEPIISRITTAFTDSAKVLLLGSDYSSYSVKCGELKFVEVVGVFQEDNSKAAEIEYKVAFIPTMFADFATMQPKYKNGITYSKKLVAKKYDDGWKLEN